MHTKLHGVTTHNSHHCEDLRTLIYPPAASLYCTGFAVSLQPLKSAMNDAYSLILGTEILTVDIEVQQWK